MDLKNLPLSNSSHNFKTPFAVKTHIYGFRLIFLFLFQVCCHPKKNGRLWRKARTRLACPGSPATPAPSPAPRDLSCLRCLHRPCLRPPLRDLRDLQAAQQQRQGHHSRPAREATSPHSREPSPSLSPICPSADSTCSNTPSYPMTAPTDVLSAKRCRYLRASRTSTASSGTRSSTTRASPARCFLARSAPRSSRGLTRWSSTWSKSTTVLSPSPSRPRLPPQTLSSTRSSASETLRWPSTRSWAGWRTLGTTCTSWSARWQAIPLTSRALEAKGQADQRRSFPPLSHKIFGNPGGCQQRRLAKFKISDKAAFPKN